MRLSISIGTRSVLFGAHQFLIHPWFVAAAWWRLYGFPLDPRLWAAFWVHDLGYLGKPNMDGPEGETHVEFGAAVMAYLFGEEWGDFTRYHSRFYAKLHGRAYSRLCVADKLAIVYTPAWLYLPMVRFTGELDEYMVRGGSSAQGATPEEWHRQMCRYVRRWVARHRHMIEDRVTVARTTEKATR